MTFKPAGEGRSSTVQTETHTIKYGASWYRTQEDVDQVKEYNRLLSRAKRRGFNTLEEYLATNPDTSRPDSKSSKKWKPTHTIKSHGVYWRSQEDLQEYRARQALIKRARNAGYDYSQLDEFIKLEGGVQKATDLAKARERRNEKEFQRLKKKHGLDRYANRIHLRAAYDRTKDPEIAAFLNILTTEDATNEKKIAEIRKLFLSGKNPYDILYQTALIVGINLRKKA